MNTATTFEMVNNPHSSTRYRRRQETKNILEFIHGGEEGSIYGAWDYLQSNATKDQMEKFIGSYKRGSFLQGVFGRAMKEYGNSEEALKQAVAMKYQAFLSRRKFQLICKTQSSVFNAEKDVWLPRNVKCAGGNIYLPRIFSDERVDKFVKSLDVGHVSEIPNYSGVSRTVTGLVFMILDLHLRLPYLRDRLIWFNENVNHFIVQFSDDGAPETSDLSMSIGSLTLWNFGDKVRSRDYQYLLHCLSASEKDRVMQDLWKQHTEEMLLLEGNVLNVCGRQCTLEFQPSADQSWQSWANGELNQAATYPSPYAFVHKGNLGTMGATIGHSDSDTWKPPTMQKRKEDLDKLSRFRESLDSSLGQSKRHEKELSFMADNSIRQLVYPRIGEYADRQRPEPVHNEINAWQHLLNVIYQEALRRGLTEDFLEVLSLPLQVSDNDQPRQVIPTTPSIYPEGTGDRARQSELLKGKHEAFQEAIGRATRDYQVAGNTGRKGCQLAFLARHIREHYNDKEKRSNNISTRLIGEQAISLARYSFRLIDALQMEGESGPQRIKRLALGKVAQYLRDAGTLFNKVDTNSAEILQLKDICTMYFNLLALFFPEAVNLTVWTVGYAIPYHAELLYRQYKVGFGIISLQAKESKHSGVKQDLNLTNRSRSTSTVGKWWQLMRTNYVRAFYLAEHQPAPSAYVSHFESRLPPHCKNSLQFCECGRSLNDISICAFCQESEELLKCAQEMIVKEDLLEILKPFKCGKCELRFPDEPTLQSHAKSVHSASNEVSKGRKASKIHPQSMKVGELKKELKARGASLSGDKAHLIRRLEGILASESS
ncbi:uncharacterized protein LOC144656016 [Oculina patagonica]